MPKREILNLKPAPRLEQVGDRQTSQADGAWQARDRAAILARWGGNSPKATSADVGRLGIDSRRSSGSFSFPSFLDGSTKAENLIPLSPHYIRAGSRLRASHSSSHA